MFYSSCCGKTLTEVIVKVFHGRAQEQPTILRNHMSHMFCRIVRKLFQLEIQELSILKMSFLYSFAKHCFSEALQLQDTC